MSKENKPLDYQRRILDTKGVAQRVDLDYLKRPNRFRDLRRTLTWIASAVAALSSIPFILGIGGGEKIFSGGPVSRSHAIFESNCRACHASPFSSVADVSCKNCHDGPAHPAKSIDTGKPSSQPRCAQCHLEHQGRGILAEVKNGNCTSCHANLILNGSGIKLASTTITSFATGKHPDFSALKKIDARPLKLNHAVHMPVQPKIIRNMKLPMKCGDCHTTDLKSLKGHLMPVTFDQHCMSCHKRELEFDVYQLLGALSAPAPHTKDPETIHAHILATYEKALAANPSLSERPLGREFAPASNPAAWLDKVVRDSESFLFDRKCQYCHEYESGTSGYPVVRKAAPVLGRFVSGSPQGEPWLTRGEFSHRAHRAVLCASCHTAARSSTKTGDILIPRMTDCTSCHGTSATHLDNCSQCHLYHNKSKESDKDRRPAKELIGSLSKGLQELHP